MPEESPLTPPRAKVMLPGAVARGEPNDETMFFEVRDDGSIDFGGALTEIQERWLQAYLETGQVREADKRVGINPTTSWRWRQRDEHFRDAFGLLQSALAEALMDEAVRRALSGPADPYSGALLLALLKVVHPNPNWRPHNTQVTTGDITVYRKILVLGTDEAGNPLVPPV